MISVYIGILALIIVLSAVWRRYKRKRKAQEFLTSVGDKGGVDNSAVLLYSVNACCKYLKQIIDAINSGDKIQICRLLRIIAVEYDKFEQFSRLDKETKGRDDFYLNYLWEATLKIAQIGRNMVVHPEYDCKALEIRELVVLTDDFPEGEILELSEISEKSKLYKEIISEMIRYYNARMSLKDYDEGSQKYILLSFLHYFHSFMISLDNLVKSYQPRNARNVARSSAI